MPPYAAYAGAWGSPGQWSQKLSKPGLSQMPGRGPLLMYGEETSKDCGLSRAATRGPAAPCGRQKGSSRCPCGPLRTMQPMTMGLQNSGKRLQYAVESRECARRVRVLKKLSKRLPLACALTAVIAAAFVGMLLSGYGPVAIYRAGGADGIAARDTRGPPFKADGAHETKLAARGAVSKTPSRGFDAKTDLGAHGTPAAQSAAEASVLAKDRVVTTAPRAALAALWRRVRDGVKRVAKRPRQSESSITTRSRGKRHKTSGTTREKRARDDGDEDRAAHKKRRVDDAFTVVADEAMLEGDDQPTASPTTSAPTVSPQPTLELTVTSMPSASPQPTVTQKPTNWIRGCKLGARRDEQCEPEADQLDGHVNRTEGPMLISCDFRPDATLEEKVSAFQALVDKGSWVVATGVADSRQRRHVRRNHLNPRRSIRGCPLRARLVFPRNFSIS